MFNFKVDDIVQIKDNPLDQDYAKRFNLTGELVISRISHGVAEFYGKIDGAGVQRLEIVPTNPFLKEVYSASLASKSVGKHTYTFESDILYSGKSLLKVQHNERAGILLVRANEIDSLISGLQKCKEAMEKVNG